MKKLKKFTFCLVFILLFATGCGVPSSEAKIEEHVKQLLTLPDKGIAKVATSELVQVGTPEYDAQMKEAVTAFCGEFVAREVIEDGSGRFFQDVIVLHCIAAAREFSYKVETVEVTKLNEGQFRYSAAVKASNQAEPFTINGSVQLDEQGLINYMSIE